MKETIQHDQTEFTPGMLEKFNIKNITNVICSHEIKRRLLLGRKVMTNIDSLSTKIRLVKAMVFPAVMYGCESWTTKKAECQRIDAFELWC